MRATLALTTMIHSIIAIHGFGVKPADGNKTVNWLKDETMLPTVCPKCQILAFGYDSLPIGENPARQSIQAMAENLLRGLVAKRKSCGRRPIVFVGHCLGGLIAQKTYTIAMVHAHDFPQIYDSATGFLSLGTPYEGLSVENGLCRMFEQIARSQMRSETNLIDGLTRDNDGLLSVVHEFTREVSKRTAPPEVFCFFEQRLTRFRDIAGVETELVCGITSLLCNKSN